MSRRPANTTPSAVQSNDRPQIAGGIEEHDLPGGRIYGSEDGVFAHGVNARTGSSKKKAVQQCDRAGDNVGRGLHGGADSLVK